MAQFQPKTVHGYALLEVASALQKTLRRGEARLAGYFALELFHSGFDQYCWKRLLIISAEDCWGLLTQEVWALYQAYILINTPRNKAALKGRVFLAKSTLLIAQAKKSRDADHLTNFVYDAGDIDTKALLGELDAAREAGDPPPDIPDYAYDVHTSKGRRQGKTTAEFVRIEHAALHPFQPGLFDDCIPPEGMPMHFAR